MNSHVSFDAAVEYPFFVVAVCADENDNWFTAGTHPEKARQAFVTGLQRGFAKPMYRIVARFDAERVRRDLALYAMPAASECVN